MLHAKDKKDRIRFAVLSLVWGLLAWAVGTAIDGHLSPAMFFALYVPFIGLALSTVFWDREKTRQMDFLNRCEEAKVEMWKRKHHPGVLVATCSGFDFPPSRLWTDGFIDPNAHRPPPKIPVAILELVRTERSRSDTLAPVPKICAVAIPSQAHLN